VGRRRQKILPVKNVMKVPTKREPGRRSGIIDQESSIVLQPVKHERYQANERQQQHDAGPPSEALSTKTMLRIASAPAIKSAFILFLSLILTGAQRSRLLCQLSNQDTQTSEDACAPVKFRHCPTKVGTLTLASESKHS